MRRYGFVIILLIAAFIPFSGALIRGEQMGPTEHIQTMLTPDAPQPKYGWDVLQADSLLQFYPWRDLVFDSWRKGQIPVVNPYQLSSTPLLANSQSGALYPFHILFAFLPGTTALKMLLLGWLHAFIGAWGMFAWLRRLNATETGAIVAGVGFASSQFIAAWSPLASVTTTVAWIPCMFACICAPSSIRTSLSLALCSGMMLLGGHLQFCFYGLLASVLLMLFQLAKSKKAVALLPFAGLILGGIIAAPQLIPVLKYSQLSHRKNVPTEEGYQNFSKGAFAPFELVTLGSSAFTGDASVQTEELESPVPTGYWPAMVKPGANAAESAISTSAFTLVFALLAWRVRGSVVPLLVLILGGLMAFGSPFNRLLFFCFPGFSATGSPGRADVLIVLGICALAGLGISRLPEIRKERKWLLLCLVPILLYGIGFYALSFVGYGDKNFDAIQALVKATTKPQLIASVLQSLAEALFILIAIKKPSLDQGPRRLWLFFFATPFFIVLSGKPIQVPNQEIESQDRVAFQSKSWNLYKTPRAFYPGNLASIARIHDVAGYDSLLDTNYVQKYGQQIGLAPFPPENGNLILFRGNARARFFEEFAVSSVVLPDQTLPFPEFKRVTAVDENNESVDAVIAEDAYDHQTITFPVGTREVLIRDRYLGGIEIEEGACTLEEKDGWRLVKCNGKADRATIRYRMEGVFLLLGLPLLAIVLISGAVLSFFRVPSATDVITDILI
jgi:hypothetical protein